MNEQTISAAILEKYPPLEEAKIDELLRREIQESPVKIIVLDDDPTGVQTVHDVSVYTDWDEESIRNGLEEKNKLFYILTNSRGLTEDQTIQVHRTIAENIAKAAKKAGVPFLVMSRSDSTLRGHYPTEPMVLKEVLEEKYEDWVFAFSEQSSMCQNTKKILDAWNEETSEETTAEK